VTDSVQSDPHQFLRDDEYLGPLVAEHGELTVEPAEDFFARFITAILRQQVSMASAAATRERLFDAVDVTPEGILAADVGTLRDAGLSRQKTRYVRNVARAFVDGLSRESLADLDDDAARERLTDITGVGEWTANMHLIY
jgi:DNA-3-methyladenine glycosylase II